MHRPFMSLEDTGLALHDTLCINYHRHRIALQTSYTAQWTICRLHAHDTVILDDPSLASHAVVDIE